MILKSRVYERKLPDRDATLFVIYCEGSRREHHYFRYFKEISSRINVEVIPADSQGNNSPLGLYEQACRDIDGVVSDTKYELVEGDQVWFVIDTDAWGEAIPELKSLCRNRIDWFVAESNPCFEVWLYYHVFSDAAGSIQLQGCSEWKNLVNARIPGGFDSRKHPMLIGDAILNASVNFRARGDEVLYGSTEVFKLGKAMYPLIASVVEKARRYQDEKPKC
jgi:hypothetical protein